MSAQITFNWYIAFTRPMAERKVADLFARKNLEHFIPLNRISRNGSTVVVKPLFVSYVFVKSEAGNLDQLKKMKGVVSIMNWHGDSAVIDQYEIEAIRRFADNHSNIKIERTAVIRNERASLLASPVSVLQNDELLELVAPSISRLNVPSLGIVLSAHLSKESVQKPAFLKTVRRSLFPALKDMVG